MGRAKATELFDSFWRGSRSRSRDGNRTKSSCFFTVWKNVSTPPKTVFDYYKITDSIFVFEQGTFMSIVFSSCSSLLIEFAIALRNLPEIFLRSFKVPRAKDDKTNYTFFFRLTSFSRRKTRTSVPTVARYEVPDRRIMQVPTKWKTKNKLMESSLRPIRAAIFFSTVRVYYPRQDT